MDQPTHQIPQTLDAPPLFLIFSARQLIWLATGVFLGILLDRGFSLPLLGLVLGTFLTRFDDRMPAGFVRHMFYFNGVPTLKGRRIPNGLDREMRP